MLERKIKIIIIILMILIVLVGVVGTILYFTTDLLKSDEMLFQKYIAQNVRNIADVINVSKEEENIDLLGKSDYTETTQANLKYLETANDEEEVYNIQEQGIIKNSESSSYRDIVATYGDQVLMKIDLLKQNNIFGLRLANLVQQFVSVENASVSYLISSMGYEGQYFSETMKRVDIAGLLDFSDEQIETLTNTYVNIIFFYFIKDHYSSKGNVVITLNNGQSVTTSSYTLTLTKNELDKIYKRILNQAINDQIILAKLDQIDAKIKEAGFNEPAGESLKELYIARLQEISNELEYAGEDTRQIAFTVYQTDGITVRTAIQTETEELILDLDETNGQTMSLEISELTNEGTDTKVYSLGKADTESGNTRSITYQDATQNLEININTAQQETGMAVTLNFNYTSDKITNLSVESNTNIAFSANEAIPIYFDESNNILLNNYEGDRILSILNSLKERAIASLENSQSIINTKLLNNIILKIDEREQRLAEEEQNNIELQKQRFNNQFILYEGEDVEYEYIQKLIEAVSRNMSDYEVVSGNQIRMFIEDGTENVAIANEIANAISDRYTYDVVINYSDDGYVNAIDIYVHQDE